MLLPVLNSYFSQLVTKCNDIKLKAVWAWLYLHLCKYLYRSPDCVKMGASVHAFQCAVKMKYHVQLSQLCGSPLISLSAKPIRDSKKSNVLIVRYDAKSILMGASVVGVVIITVTVAVYRRGSTQIHFQWLVLRSVFLTHMTTMCKHLDVMGPSQSCVLLCICVFTALCDTMLAQQHVC